MSWWVPLGLEEALTLLVLLVLLSYALGARRHATALLLVALAGCGPHKDPRSFGHQLPTPIGYGQFLFSTEIANRAWCEQAAQDHWNNVVGLQQLASNFGVGSVLNGAPTVYVLPGRHLDSPHMATGRGWRIDSAGGLWVAEGEYSTLPELTHGLAHWYWQRAEDHSMAPVFWAVVEDTDAQVVRALRLARAP